MNKQLSIFTVLFLMAMLALVSCSGQRSSDKDAAQADSALFPDSEVTGATYYLYEKGRVTTRIYADSTHTFESIDSTIAYELNIFFLDSAGNTTSNLVADSGVIREEEGIHHIYGHLVLDFYDSTGVITSNLVGDSGIIGEAERVFEIFGEVIGINENNRKLETDYLKWSSKADQVTTESFVKFTKSDGTVLRGRGFEADRTLSRARILNQVSGTWVDSDDSDE